MEMLRCFNSGAKYFMSHQNRGHFSQLLLLIVLLFILGNQQGDKKCLNLRYSSYMRFIKILQICFKIMQTLVINILYLTGANGTRALTTNSVQAFFVDGPRFCFLPHFTAPITTLYNSQPAVCV